MDWIEKNAFSHSWTLLITCELDFRTRPSLRDNSITRFYTSFNEILLKSGNYEQLWAKVGQKVPKVARTWHFRPRPHLVLCLHTFFAGLQSTPVLAPLGTPRHLQKLEAPARKTWKVASGRRKLVPNRKKWLGIIKVASHSRKLTPAPRLPYSPLENGAIHTPIGPSTSNSDNHNLHRNHQC